MLLQAASPMAIPIVVLDPEVTAPAKQVSQPSVMPLADPPLQHVDGAFTSLGMISQLAQQVDILTIEIEHVDVDALEHVANEFKTTGGRSGQGVKVYPAPSIIRTIQDKYAQKVHLQGQGIPVAPFLPITSSPATSLGSNPRDALRESVLSAAHQFGYPLMLKSRHLAYDGKGNFVLKSADGIDEALQALIPEASLATGKPIADRLYAEKWAPFVKEVAVMVVRGVDGQTRSYPAVETIHRDSVCHIVYAPLRPVDTPTSGIGKEQRGMGKLGEKSVDRRAQEAAEKAIDALGEGAVGVFGVEMFLLPDGSLLLNEIAPRPHNSGHYTIEACNYSQYTAHLYAILSLPLPPIKFIPSSAAMLNLLGWSASGSDDFLKPDGVVRKAIGMGAAVHLYGKAGCRKGRKMGHVTIMGESDEEVKAKIDELVDVLPGDYKNRTIAPVTQDSKLPLVSVIMGSDSDLPVMLPATKVLKDFGVPYEVSIVSAHRTPARMVEFARTAEGRGVRVIIAGAGGAAHLPGMVGSETTLPVLGVPVKASVLDGVDSLYSIVQMPRGIPVAAMAINNSMNAGLLAVRILSLQIPRLREQLENYVEGLEDEVLAKVEALAELGAEKYVQERLVKK
ncbi:Phosphoribosylaminoimidazole carboxylase [Leucosporidium creatinivorum]|uniref:Phosphoribosylaminoimidazole carboxylase n=1 Tax=Leucosporidium creatinivorum TaxID=106004 RepID=A0A1Y2FHT7_9BASI|nr:Phosphoribosylaminoimidazole carboxylase [Leucosporidium creatinivorum]